MVGRRTFIASAMAALAAPGVARATSVPRAGATRMEHAVGRFVVAVDPAGPSLRVTHLANPERVLWESLPGEGFLAAARGEADIRSFGTPQGSFTITDRVEISCDRQAIDEVRADGDALIVSGTLSGDEAEVGYRLTLEEAAANHLRFAIRLHGPDADRFNRTSLRYASSPDEAFFGFGQQLTDFDQKGNLLPILVQEHGVGRGRPVVTQLIDAFANGGGRDPFVTEAPAPHYLTSHLRSLFLENTEYSTFDLRRPDRVEVTLFSAEMTGGILAGDPPLSLIETYTAYSGRMRALPDWIHQGAIVAVQGGTDEASRKLDELEAANIPLAGLWIQDWTGVRTTSAGKQLWWNWRLDESQYPGWDDLVARLERRGARMLVYINPFLSMEPGHDDLFEEGQRNGYLVERADGSPYPIRNTSFSAAMIDLSDPDCRAWIKGVIKDELIGRAGASGWMADFGEALPFDGVLHDGADPAAWHNHFPEAWAQVNREAIEEAGRGDDIVFFNRSGFTRSPGHSTLFWLGDQLESWDEFDGIKTAVVGLLSGGVSGFSLVHSDIGGYVSLSISGAGHKLPVIARSKELLLRWMELNAFTAVFRTHEGLDPSVNAQFDTDAETMAHLARFAGVYAALAPYRQRLVDDAARLGHPVVRHPFLHYPDDPITRNLRWQFLLGPDLLVAPVLDKGASSVRVYAPAGSDEWINLWTGERLGDPGRWHEVAAPLGQPAVFHRAGSDLGEDLTAALAARGIA